MILFQEQFYDLENSGMDNLPDSAYFAHLSRPSMGSGTIDQTIIDQITQKVIEEAGTRITDNVLSQIGDLIDEKVDDAVSGSSAFAELNTKIETLQTELTTMQELIAALTERIETLETTSNHKEMTQVEYDALNPTEKMKDITYFIS